MSLIYLHLLLMPLLQVRDFEQMIQERLQKKERLKYSMELQKVRLNPSNIISTLFL